MYPRFYKPLKGQSFFLFGPRATGKTTWLKHAFPESERIDLLDAETARLLMSSPLRLAGLVGKDSKHIIIDEIQKVPELLDEVHRLMEEKKWTFTLTGSSARKLRRGAANLLAGRAIQTYFHPLTIWELGKDFKMDHALRFGLLPKAWTDPDPKAFLSSYVYTYLKEEVQAEGLTRRIDHFSQFLEVISFSQAQILSLSSIASDVGVDAKVIAHYIDVLEDLLLGQRLTVFRKRAKRRLSSHPKFFLFDSGVFNSLRPRGPLDSEAEMSGPALETLFYHHHRTLGSFTRWDQQLHFWRTDRKVEVDFVSYGPLGLFAFEIKGSALVRSEDLAGLRLFLHDYPMAKAFCFYGGTRHYRQDGIEILNFQDGLMALPELMGVEIPILQR